MAPDATTEKIQENKSRFNSRQAVRSNLFMSKEAPSGGKSRQQIIRRFRCAVRSDFSLNSYYRIDNNNDQPRIFDGYR